MAGLHGLDYPKEKVQTLKKSKTQKVSRKESEAPVPTDEKNINDDLSIKPVANNAAATSVVATSVVDAAATTTVATPVADAAVITTVAEALAANKKEY